MRKMILNHFRTVLVASGIAALSLATTPIASAAGVNVFSGACPGSTSTTTQGAQGAQGTPTQGSGSTSTGGSSICGAASNGDFLSLIKNVVNILLVALGMIAVIMIIIGGVRYSTSNGDSSQVKSAKDTIMYAVIGLIVAIMAYAIVNFILGFFKS